MNKYFVPTKEVVMCAPGTAKGIELDVENGFATVKQKTTLIGLKLVANCEFGSKDDTVFFKGDVCKLPWFIEVYDLNGLTFVLAPAKQILITERSGEP